VERVERMGAHIRVWELLLLGRPFPLTPALSPRERAGVGTGRPKHSTCKWSTPQAWRIERRIFAAATWSRPWRRLTLCTLRIIVAPMSSAYVSGRVPLRYERLVAKQARAAKTSKSNLVARYVMEKALESDFPGISFRDSLSGREAYLTGHRVAVWEVVDAYEEVKSIEGTAEHFHWPSVLVKRALAYARAFPEEIRGSREGERHGGPAVD